MGRERAQSQVAQAGQLGVRYEFLFRQASGPSYVCSARSTPTARLPVIGSVFPIEQTLEPLTYVEQGRTTAGKVVVAMQPVAD